MKQLILGLLLSLSILTANAHLEAGCNINGNYQLHIVNGLGCTTTVSVDGGVAVNVTITSNDQIFLIPNNPIVVHHVVAVICGNVFTITTGTNVCNPLAMKIINPNAITIHGDSIRVTFTSLDETNVKYYKMSVSLDDGLTWREVWIYTLGILPKRDYSVTFKK